MRWSGARIVRPQSLLTRAAGGVHEALGLYEQKLVAVVARLPYECPALVLPVAHAQLIGQRVHRIEPGVVPRVLVLLARIPQARDHIQLVTYFRHSSLEE